MPHSEPEEAAPQRAGGKKYFSVTKAAEIFAILGVLLTAVNLFIYNAQNGFQASTRELDLYSKVSELNRAAFELTSATAERRAYLESVKIYDRTHAMRLELDKYHHTFIAILEQKYLLLDGIRDLYQNGYLDKKRFDVLLRPMITGTTLLESFTENGAFSELREFQDALRKK